MGFTEQDGLIRFHENKYSYSSICSKIKMSWKNRYVEVTSL